MVFLPRTDVHRAILFYLDLLDRAAQCCGEPIIWYANRPRTEPYHFDWSQVAYNTNPLLSPSWAAVNVFAGFAAFFWIVVPGIFYTNTWFTAYLLLMTSDVYDRTGAVYDTARVISPQSTLDLEAYKSYSPPYLGATFAFVYGLSFASITGVLTHIGVWHYKDIWAAFRGKNRLDVHARLMKSYKKTPWYWYAAIIVAMTAISIAMVEVYKAKLPIYGIFLALAIPAIYMIPCGIVQGITNVNANQLNVLAEFIGGYMFEGKPLANMIFKILSTDVVGQGIIYFAMDMKLGHYLKIPPRSLFLAQGLATILGALTQAGVTIWMLGHISDICSEDQPDGFSCPNGRTVYSSSVIWGLVGPRRLYSVGQIYSSLLYFFWIGAIAPLVTYALYKITKKEYWKYVSWPLIFTGTANVPPGELVFLPTPLSRLTNSYSNGNKLLQLGPRKLHLQPLHQTPLLRLVDQVQLHPRRSPRHGPRAQRNSHLLLHILPRCRIPGLVGKHCIPEHR